MANHETMQVDRVLHSDKSVLGAFPRPSVLGLILLLGATHIFYVCARQYLEYRVRQASKTAQNQSLIGSGRCRVWQAPWLPAPFKASE